VGNRLRRPERIPDPRGIAVCREAIGGTAFAVEAGRTLMLDKEEMLAAANAAGITVIGHEQ